MSEALLGKHVISYELHDVTDYISWPYLFHAWGFQWKYAEIADIHACKNCQGRWVQRFPSEEQPKALQASALFNDATKLIKEFDGKYKCHAIVLLAECNSYGNDIVLYINGKNVSLPFLRQQCGNPPFLCMSDFIRPMGMERDTIGIFCTSVDCGIENSYQEDPYLHMVAQTLADRFAEAAAEKLHEQVRKELWGYAKDERLTFKEMNEERFQGIRPAVGYPCMPDISLNKIIDRLLNMSSIGIRLTESAMMLPHASVSGLMISHKDSRYFNVGPIGHDQIQDYSRRRGINIREIERFLMGNIIKED